MPTYRLAAWCGIVAGLLITIPSAIEIATGETAATSLLLGISPALAAPLVVALHLRQQHRTGTFAFTLNLIGLGLFGGAAFLLNEGVFYLSEPVAKELLQGPTKPVLLACAAIFAAGTIAFSVTMTRARVHPRIPSITYGVVLPVLALAAPLPDNLVISGLHITSGLTLVWLGAALAGYSNRNAGNTNSDRPLTRSATVESDAMSARS
ncbi:hypothetical protein [Actinokineospora enzanensis]|uniref:hypothetical protein n=1 Tax=Actinokineospora enzanensis TaxID=155975 RepID=UPI0003733686|nr:hypothetical protein [Actinokineospora enzanensis]